MPELAWPSAFTRHVNWLRLIFHLMGGSLAATMAWNFPRAQRIPIALVFAGIALAIEILRATIPAFRQTFQESFGVLMKKTERHHLTGFTWVVASGVVAAFFVNDRQVIALAFLIWAFGDAAAVAAGTLMGGPTIFRRSKKTWAGSIAGLLAVIIVTSLALSSWHAIYEIRLVALAAAAFFATETFSRSVGLDDNLTIPLVEMVVLSLF